MNWHLACPSSCEVRLASEREPNARPTHRPLARGPTRLCNFDAPGETLKSEGHGCRWFPNPESREEADEGAYRRWRGWRGGGGRVSHPERGGVRPRHHDLRRGRADGWRALSGRQCGDWLQYARFRL